MGGKRQEFILAGNRFGVMAGFCSLGIPWEALFVNLLLLAGLVWLLSAGWACLLIVGCLLLSWLVCGAILVGVSAAILVVVSPISYGLVWFLFGMSFEMAVLLRMTFTYQEKDYPRKEQLIGREWCVDKIRRSSNIQQ